jgi:hypothetical protein
VTKYFVRENRFNKIKFFAIEMSLSRDISLLIA